MGRKAQLARYPRQRTFAVSIETFDREVLAQSRQLPVLVDFWAEWCLPCMVIAPVLERVALRYAGRAAIAKLEVDKDENMKIAGRYRVRGFPTVILFRDGEELDRFSGVRTERAIDLFIESHL